MAAIALYLAMAAMALLINGAASDGTTRYTNHTVGDSAGWVFNSNTNKTSADFTAWAAKQTFNLGDFLIFNTITNETVIQTYNKTTYDSCITDDALDSDTFQYDGGSNEFGQTLTIPVPLTIEGAQYYFSDADDGEQCQHGMAFEIKVGHGLGLPLSLSQPPPPPYAPPPVPSDEGQSPPISVVTNPSNNGGMRAGVGICWLFLLLLVILSFLQA
ncbi:unnamed protein product [Fraxinus pennsylvanica]|uniref:Phytocyanin domain-containing protein n=1 Tax=Fraxinus pennsylvanica TaxID=56036 RepID=A0AAD2DZ90_9LAMI|nr:unnamed protein product [Fraxinus pennsylvanica]